MKAKKADWYLVEKKLAMYRLLWAKSDGEITDNMLLKTINAWFDR